ncbi:MAG: NmrA family NAD(P)-binding protein [Scytolyngbya sp. HA4215-MV1]|nr:NmrA family NAD(P)-binding protein [Scytolyngbya sp. HA4215-MV1]
MHLDLDDLSTYAAALQGVQRLFMVTGYTVEMMNQGKNLTDAAKGQGG